MNAFWNDRKDVILQSVIAAGKRYRFFSDLFSGSTNFNGTILAYLLDKTFDSRVVDVIDVKSAFFRYFLAKIGCHREAHGSQSYTSASGERSRLPMKPKFPVNLYSDMLRDV